MIRAWHFVGKTLRDGSPIPADGEWLEFTGKIELCRSGLHASRDPFDALRFAPGNTLCLVDCAGDVVESKDKLVCSRRRIVARMEARELLLYFARMQALSVVHLWDAPGVVLDYLMTGDDADAAYAAANAAANAANANAAADAAYAAATATADAATATADAAYAAAYADADADAAYADAADAAYAAADAAADAANAAAYAAADAANAAAAYAAADAAYAAAANAAADAAYAANAAYAAARDDFNDLVNECFA
jgi:hypothetical protein